MENEDRKFREALGKAGLEPLPLREAVWLLVLEGYGPQQAVDRDCISEAMRRFAAMDLIRITADPAHPGRHQPTLTLASEPYIEVLVRVLDLPE